jgi:hypothetical protein
LAHQSSAAAGQWRAACGPAGGACNPQSARAAGIDLAASAREHRRRNCAADAVAGRFAPRSNRRGHAADRSRRAAMEFRDSIRNAVRHRDRAVRDFARWRRRYRRAGQAGVAGAILARCRTGRTRPRADLAERRANFGADVGGAADNGLAIARRPPATGPGAEPRRVAGGRDIVVRDGAPRQRTSAPAGHFLDRAL